MPSPACPIRGIRAAAALLALLGSAPAAAYPGGVTGYSGRNGIWCRQCHSPAPSDGYTLTLEVPPGPYTVHDVYELTLVGRRSTAFLAGVNVAASGTLTLPAGSPSDVAITGGELRHTTRRASTPTGTGQHEIRWRVLWRPPPLGPSDNNEVRLHGASNGSAMRNVVTDGSGACLPNSPESCGIPLTVERVPCDDEDHDTWFPADCLPDPVTRGGDCDDDDANANPGRTEICNGVDDDCDGSTDEGYILSGRAPGQSCDGPDPDACLDGTVTCGPTGVTVSCVETVDNTERCNGVDDDCDGLTDEGYSTSTGQPLGAACDGSDTDQCAQGTVACVTPSLAVCVEDGAGGGELCNEIDDDCDGLTDELYTTVGQACDGPDADRCALGARACKADGSGVECVENDSRVESCNGVDDDCDGLTDEGFFGLGQSCDGPDVDRCVRGVKSCSDDGSAVVCVETVSTPEVCNGVDDDCDFAVDEVCLPDAGMVDAGPLDAGGSDAGAPDAATCLPELCNEVDDDCDGLTDEDFADVGQPCDGDDDDLCESGVRACNAAGSASECLELDSYAELCNGQDDDCDGDVDEGFQLRGLPVGSPCDGDDADRCINGAVTCSATGQAAICDEAASFAETCNDLDDDCDGDVDEGYSGLGLVCDSDDADQCVAGFIRCNATGDGVACQEEVHREETCNGADDDCDGVTDPGCPVDAGVPDAFVPDAAAVTPDAGDAAVDIDAGDGGVEVELDAGDADDAAERPYLVRGADAGLPPFIDAQVEGQGCSAAASSWWLLAGLLCQLARRRPSAR